MSEAEQSLEGWAPEPSDDLPLARIIDLAFDYRGNTTVVKMDGTEILGYLYNRSADGPEPFVQLFDASGAGPIRISYTEIRTVRFTGKDTAAGNSYAAWLKRRETDGAEASEASGRRTSDPVASS